MSIKKLFDSTNKSRNYLSETDEKNAFEAVESGRNVRAIKEKQDTFVPQIDYSDPANFAKYGSAYLYYKSAMTQIYDYYPYDGSDAEINEYYNRLLDIEKYVFNNLYPRTNGLIHLSADGWGTRVGGLTDGYGLPNTQEYISFFGGPTTASYDTLAAAFPEDNTNKYQYSNIYDTDIYTRAGLPADYGSGSRESNLKCDFARGVTVEFWLNKSSFNFSNTKKEVILDIWNTNNSSSTDYGRLTIELMGSSSLSPFRLTAMSGTSGISSQIIGTNITTGSISGYHHYAVSFYNSGSTFNTKLYVDGALEDHNTVVGVVNEINSKNIKGRIGSLVGSPSGSAAAAGAGKLSGSLDEFRFWKVRRDSNEIARYWKTQVRGGTNTDISNTTLGIYYKFNEGITGDNSIDSMVLDYGGRITNGSWIGYSSNSRATSSAIVLSNAATSEYRDPIIYSSHPSVSSLQTSLLNNGEYHDANNNGMFVNLMPSWILEADEEATTDLRLVSHIVATYLDKLALQINALPKLKRPQYTSASATPLPFAQHLPQSMGLYTPEIFVDATVLEKFLNRTQDQFLQGDLEETKNLIYLNLYNSLVGIYKAKGTEKAIRNVFRCFNLDDRVIKFRTYSDSQTYELQNNLQTVLEPNYSVNLSDSANLQGVVYQKADASNSNSYNFISGTYSDNKEDRYGFTVEANVIFPSFERRDAVVDRGFTEVSLFGLAMANTASVSDTTWASPDPVNFQVYAVRDEVWSKNVYFKLTSSVVPFPLPVLTSSTYFGVYNNEEWNFSVRLKPSNYPLADMVTGSSTFTYDLEFRGVNTLNDTIQNNFLLTSSVSQAVGSELLKSAKRVYAGARKTNITGAIQAKSDVLFTNMKYWTKYLEYDNITQHTYDINNAGISGSYKNISALDANLSQIDVLNSNTLALHWTFSNITGSDSSGNFYYVQDMSSGSALLRDKYGWPGAIAGYQHTGYGHGFKVSSTDVIKKDLTNITKFVDPESPIAANMINIMGDSENVYGVVQTRPKFFHVIEKSMYASISEDMLSFFAGVIDFNNVIGDPVNRYRMRYKALEKLREIFFRKVTTVSSVEKFIDYYKWLDDAIAIIVSQLVPASAPLIENSYNTIESHVLERNKYRTQFPTIEFVAPDPETPIMGINEKLYNWRINHAPLSNNQNENTVWWKERADRLLDKQITSGDTDVDRQRENVRETANIVNAQTSSTVSTVSKQEYQTSVDVLRTRALPYRLVANNRQMIKGGVNFENTKNIALTYNALAPAGPVNTSLNRFIPINVLLAFAKDINVVPISSEVDPSKKVKRFFGVHHGREWQDGVGYYNAKSSFIFPFNVISSSVVTGYNKAVIEKVTGNIEITNLHNDVYGRDMEKPMQGPFTEYAVGGHQSRHVELNRGGDNYTNRPEAWKLLLGTLTGACNPAIGYTGAIGMVGADYPWPEANEVGATPYPMTASQKAVYYRGLTAKSPVNIRNIHMTTGSAARPETVLGNYRKTYDIVNSVGGYQNPRGFVESPPQIPSNIVTGSLSPTQGRSILDIRRTAESHFEFVPEYSVGYYTASSNKSIIRQRFSSPGGIETIGQGYGDIRSDEYSVYNAPNYRNWTVLRPFQNMSGTVSEATGAGTPGIRVFDINGKDFGLYWNLTQHAGRFGRSSTLVNNPGASYDQAPSYIKINRNPRHYLIQTGPNTYATSSQFDNFWVQHQIPRADRQYAWITGALAPSALNGGLRYYGYAPTTGPQTGYYEYSSSAGRRYVAYFDFVSASSVLGNAGTASLYQPALDLNIYVQSPVDESDDNTNGYALDAGNLKYYNTTLLDTVGGLIGNLNRPADYLNLLLTQRKSTFGYRCNPQTGPTQNALLRNHRKNNILTIHDGTSLSRYTVKPFTSRGKPALINMDVHQLESDGTVGSTENVTLKTSYANELVYFSDTDLTEHLFPNGGTSKDLLFDQLTTLANSSDSYTLNWVLYSEALFPTAENEYTSGSSTRIGYDNLFWRSTNLERYRLHNSSVITNSYGVQVEQSSWPLDAPLGFLSRSISAIPKINQSSDLLLRMSNSAGELQNEYVHALFGLPATTDAYKARNCVISGLYARKHMLGGQLSVVSGPGQPIPETGSMFSRHSEFAQFQNYPIYTGEAYWDAPANAGIVKKSGATYTFESHPSEPWFKDYAEYEDELGRVSKGYSIIPEFRISERVEDYESSGLSVTTETFEIVGTDKNSTQSSFYKDYSNSEFMKNFSNIQGSTFLDPNEIMLACSASIRLMPYKGFYPAQRTMELVKRFKDSYGDSVLGQAGALNMAGGSGGLIRPLAQAMFAPGLLYNTIKSGIAIDYPVATIAPKIKKAQYGFLAAAKAQAEWMLTPNLTGTATTVGQPLAFTYQGGEYWDYRIPFEGLINPEEYITNLQFFDMEPHPSASLNATSSFMPVSTDTLYPKMASNFFGEIANFFLKDAQYTRLESRVVTKDLRFKTGSIYGARLKLRRSMSGSRIYNSESGSGGNNTCFDMYGGKYFDAVVTPPRFRDGNSYPLPQDPRQLLKEDFQESFTLYSRPTAFGPAVAGRPEMNQAKQRELLMTHPWDSLTGFNGAYTPPYYDGEAWLDIIFQPNHTETYDLEKILSEVKTRYWRCDPGPSASADLSLSFTKWKGTQFIPTISGNFSNSAGTFNYGDTIYGGKNINSNIMQLSASVNPFGVERVLKTQIDKFGNEILVEDETIGMKWVIQPKMETPMPNFNNLGIRPIVKPLGTISVPTFASQSVPRGMWHQFGAIEPDPNKGIFLEIGEIPKEWLKGHYDVISNDSIYNKEAASLIGNRMFKLIKPLTDVIKFDSKNTSVKLGQLAESRTIKEAVVAIPYQVGTVTGKVGSSFETKKFFEIDSARVEAALSPAIGSADGDSLEYSGLSIRRMVETMQQYVLPPNFDFLNNPDINPMPIYFFEFEYRFDKDDLNYIWQNLAPRNYKKITKTVASTAHTLGDNELMTAEDIMNENTRWMVFKVKQKSQVQYEDFITAQAGQSANPSEVLSTLTTTAKLTADLDVDTYPIEYNWPYDYVSFVESVKFEAQVLYKNSSDEETAVSATFDRSPGSFVGAPLVDTVSGEQNGFPTIVADKLASIQNMSVNTLQDLSSQRGLSAELFNAVRDVSGQMDMTNIMENISDTTSTLNMNTQGKTATTDSDKDTENGGMAVYTGDLTKK